MMGKQADFPDPAQPRGTGGVCTAARRNTGNRGNSISASCARVPTSPLLTELAVASMQRAALLI